MSTNPTQPPILISIDLQQGMVEGATEWGPRSTPNLEKNVAYLLSYWRSQSWPLIHIQHDDIDDPENPISAKFPATFAIHPIAKPLTGEPLYVKHTGSAFVGTPLKDELEKIREADGEKGGLKRKVILIGMDGGQCVNSTARHGADLGYKIVVVGDASASYGTKEWDGSGKSWGDRVDVPADVTHKIAMGMIEGYGKVVTTEELMKEFEKK